MRRTPLKRGTTGLQRTPMSRRRVPLRQVSDRRLAEAPERAAVRARVLARDRVCQVKRLSYGAYAAGPCFGPLTPHHRRKEGQGGATSDENLVAVCAHHNGAMEADAGLARWAHAVGLVVRQGDDEWQRLGATRRP